MNWYTDRVTLKRALNIPASTTAGHVMLDSALEGVSRLVDDYLGYAAFPASAVRDFTAHNASCLHFNTPLLSVDSIRTDSSGNGSYGTTLSTADYYLAPANATAESPKRPFWEFESRYNATALLPAGIKRGVRITGTWGYYDERSSPGTALSTALTANATTAKFANSSRLFTGMTLLIDTERVFVTLNGKNGSDTATTSGIVSIQRGINGSVGATHSSNSTVEFYTFPIISNAVVFQAAQDYRAKDAPLGFTGGQPFGTEEIKPRLSAGLHPFARRMLDGFRVPEVR